MSKAVKMILGVLGVLVVVFGAVLAYVVATFDPNQYKQHVVAAVKESTQRTLKLEGDVQLSVFPNIALAVSKVSLSEPNVDKTALQAEAVRISVRLIPLLSKRVEIKTIQLKGVAARVVRSKEGKLNFEDLIGAGATPPTAKGSGPKPDDKAAPAKPAEPRPPAPAVEIAGIEVEGASIDYIDEVEGKRYGLSNVQVKTGRVADGVPGKLQLAFAVKADQPAVALNFKGDTDYLFEAEKQHVRLTDLDVSVKGSAPGVKDLETIAKGSIEASGSKSELLVSKLTLTASGKQPDGSFSLKLDVPKLAVTPEKLSADKISLDAAVQDARQKLQAQLKIPGVEGERKSFTLGPLETTVTVEGGGRTVKASLTSKISGNLENRQFEIPQISATVNAVDPTLPRSPVEAKLDGSARVDMAKEEASLQFITQLDESRIEGKAGLTRFSQPSYTFDLSIDQLDADRYSARPAGGKAQGDAPAAKPASDAGDKAGEEPIDLTGLQSLTANGAIQIGRLKVANLSTSQVRADIKAANGRLDVSPFSASLYGGSLSGALSAQSASAPLITLKQQLSNVNLGALLKDAANSDKLEGTMTFSLDVTTQGSSVPALKKGLNGKGALTILDGSIQGIDLAGMIRDAKTKLRELRGKKTQGENKSEKTSFTELKATFTLKNGVAHNSDLTMKSPLLRVAGEGRIDIGNDQLDYLVKPTLVGTTKGQGGRDASELAGVTIPVRASGPLKNPQYTIDYTGLAEELGKGLLDSATDTLKGKTGSGAKPQDRLKGFLGR